MEGVKVEVYGPGVREGAADEIRRAMEGVGLRELAACAMFATGPIGNGDGAVLFGARELVRAVDPFAFDFPSGMVMRGPWCVVITSRVRLAALLDAAGRLADAAKVRTGSPDEPRPECASLLVCAVEGAVAVMWFEPPQLTVDPLEAF